MANEYWNPAALGGTQPMLGYAGQPAQAPANFAVPNYMTPAAPGASPAVGQAPQFAAPGGAAGWTDPMTLIGGANALFGGWMGLQQLDLAKDSLSFQKDAFWKNYNAQRKTLNADLEDRQRRRASANPNVESAESYMKRNGI